MISAVVICLSLLLAGAFTLVYLFRPGWRARIERPKYFFQDQLQRYDRQSEGLTSQENRP